MKDITITASQLKRELIVYLAFFGFAFILNIYAIIVHNGAWSELFSQLHIVLMLSVFFYVLVGLIRIIVHLVRRYFINNDLKSAGS